MFLTGKFGNPLNNFQYNFLLLHPSANLENYQQIDLDRNAELIVGANLEWLLQAYLILKQRGNLNVICSNHFVPGCINIIHSDDLIKLRGTSKDFIVCIKGDFPWRKWAHYHIVQNQNELKANTSFLPLWVQPGLIKRNADRKGVTRVAYAGQTWNGNLAGTEQTWTNLFKPHAIEFVNLPTGACHDLRDIDVLIGIRSFDDKPYNSKPPSKLVNAWHAHIPFIGGNDSAFKQVGTPGKDYLLATSHQEVLNAVLQLRDDPNFYQTLVNNGIEKTIQFTREAIATKWEDILMGPVVERLNKWDERQDFERNRFTSLSRLGSMKHQSKQLLKKIIGSHFIGGI